MQHTKEGLDEKLMQSLFLVDTAGKYWEELATLRKA
jgi:hypothetical protein